MTRGNQHPGDGADNDHGAEVPAGDRTDCPRMRRRQKWQETQQRHGNGGHRSQAATSPPHGHRSAAATSPPVAAPEPSEGDARLTPPVGGAATHGDRLSVPPTTAATIDADDGDDDEDDVEDEDDDEGGGNNLFPRPPCTTTTSIVPFEDTKAKLGSQLRATAVVSTDEEGLTNGSGPLILRPGVVASRSLSATAAIGPLPAAVTRKRRLIATGLGNLGNTCFMNSTLQCLAHTPPLRSYFLSGSFERDLNTDNPLGTGGELAREFARLLGQMWQIEDTTNGHHRRLGGAGGIYASSRIYSPGNGGSYDAALSPPAAATYPRSFKTTLGKHASQFVGYDQHDSQELAIYLLDALHEDTNSVRKKPYIERPEQAEDEPDAVASTRAWDVHLRRDDSRIVASFMGQVKSRLQCPEPGCGRVSTTFDPSMYLSVPIPGGTDRSLGVTFVPAAGGAGCAGLTAVLPKNATVGTLRARVTALARECYGLEEEELREEDVVLAEIFHQKVLAYYNKMDCGIDRIKDGDAIYAYQLFPLKRAKEEYEAHKMKKQEEEKEEEEREKKRQQRREEATTAGLGPAISDCTLPPPSRLDAATRADLDSYPTRWENALTGYLATGPLTLSWLLNQQRSTHDERLGFYRKLLTFVRRCKQCPDAAAPATAMPGGGNASDDDTGNRSQVDGDVTMDTNTIDPSEDTVGKSTERAASEAQANVDDTQTLEEVSYSSRQFKGVKTPRDLAILEYCASKLLAAICELKDDRENNTKKAIGENGMLVQIRIKKSNYTANKEGGINFQGGRYPSTSNAYGKSPSSLSSQNWKIAGEPLVCRISPTLTVGGLRRVLGDCVSRALRPEQGCGQKVMTIMRQVALSYENDGGRQTDSGGGHVLGSVTEDQLIANGTAVFAKSNDAKEMADISSIVDPLGIILLSWPPQYNNVLDVDTLFSKEEFLTKQQKQEKQAAESDGGSNHISVMDCIAKYCEMEQLDETDAWYCNRCKDHVRAWKQFDLYRAPPILIIHLKRFHFSSTTHRRDKIDTFIDFPLVDLDLKEVVRHWGEQEPIYDCYAVSNHFGGLGGGHYTAYAKLDDGTWCNFDDSRVSIVDKSEVVSSAAYCLYYKRKDVVVFDEDDENVRCDDDALMTSRTEEDSFSAGMAMPVSPSPCGIEVERGNGSALSNDHCQENFDVMEVDHSGSSGSIASYTTPTGGVDEENHHSPNVDVTFDLQ